MIGNYPITWLVTELISVVLFTLCIFHALNQKNYKQKVFELLCFIIGSGIFEHVGVLSGLYSYDHHRILMVGLIPLSVLLLEAVIMYSAFVLFEYLDMPKWTVIWVVGFLCTFQDMSIDPVYANNVYSYGGMLSGQWNWNLKYSNTFFGIPFFNFSGWLYMTGFYAGMILLGRWLYNKYNKKAIGVAYPFVAGLLLILPLAAFGLFLISGSSRNAELIKLIANCVFPIILMAVYWKKIKPIDLKKDKIIFIVPIVLRLYDIIVGFGLGITISYIPVIVCSVIHFAYLFYLYKKARKAEIVTQRLSYEIEIEK